MAAKKRPTTWIEVAVRNGGFRNAIKALSWAHSWIHVQVALDRDPSVDEVAEWWAMSRRTAFREQAAFRECFPALDTPAAIYADPKQKAAVRKTVAVLKGLDAAKRSKQAAKDSDLLDVGLLNPGV